jgi:diaminopimelate epimerase
VRGYPPSFWRAEVEFTFSKLTGSGNDFILVDNMDGHLDVDSLRERIPKICARAQSVGADGVIFLEPSRNAHFKWRFFNADGSEAEMCGNGGRCAARFAYDRGIAPREMAFETLAGLIKAKILKDGEVRVQLTPPREWHWKERLVLLGEEVEYSFVNTGVPHVVIFVEDLEGVDVRGMGKQIRFHPRFAPAGTNVNFVQVRDRGRLAIRTYERGVEDETLACGTGATAAALVYLGKGKEGRVEVLTKSGEVLVVDKRREEVYLQGGTRWVYDGQLRPEAWEW